MKHMTYMLECVVCGFAENPPDARICGQCSSTLPIICPNCATVNPHGFSFCGQCATPLTQSSPFTTTKRVVTVLFADVCNYTSLTNRLGAETMYLLLDPCLRRLAETIQRFEGTIDKFTGDGLIAVFGLPIALEQHASQAAQAALAMFDELTTYNAQIVQHTPDLAFQIRVGLASGEVIAGQLGSDRYSDTTVIGEAVNLAARLQQVAEPNTIMVSEVTALNIAQHFTLDPPQTITLKGFEQAVIGHVLRGIRSDTEPTPIVLEQTPFIGRQTEQAIIQNAIDVLNSDVGGIVGLMGQAGIGKTRLTNEVLNIYRQQGVTVYDGECTSAARHVPYSAFLNIVTTLCGITPTDSDEEIHAKIAAVKLGTVSTLIDLVPYIEYLLSIELVDEALLSKVNHFDPEQLKRQVFLALREMFVSHARRQPLILVLDNLQWADDVSLELIEYLAQSVDSVPLLLYLMARDDEAPQLKTRFEQLLAKVNQRGALVSLEPLNQASSVEVAKYLLPNASQVVLEYMSRQSDGIPFYIEEFARHAREVGTNLQAIDERELDTVSLPLSLNALIRGRFDRLPTRLARTLSQAAVIGRTFSAELLDLVADSFDVERDLEQLHQRGFISQPKENEAWRFQHILTHETVYASMLATQRSSLHEQVGLALETLITGRNDKYVDDLAYHFARSHRRDKAILYLVLAGQRAAERYANQDALRMFDQVERLIKIDPSIYVEEAAIISEQRGMIFNLIGQHDKAHEAYQHAIDIADQYNFMQPPRIANLYRFMASNEEKQGKYEQAWQHLNLARETLGDGPLLDHARIDADAGWIAMIRGNLVEAERLLSVALNIAELREHESLQAIIANRLAGVYWQRGDLQRAHALVAQCLSMSRRLNDQLAVAKALNNLGIIANDQLDWATAETHYTQSMEMYIALGDVHGHIRTAHNISVNAVMLGKLNQALQSSQTALLLAQQVGDETHASLSHLQQGMIAMLVRDYPRARRSLIKAECSFRLLKGHISKRADVAEQLTRLAYAQGRLKLAHRFARRAVRFALYEGNPTVVFRAQRVFAFLSLHGQTPHHGETLFNELEGQSTNPLEKGVLYMAWGEALAATGAPVRAQVYYKRAGELFDLVNAPTLLRRFI